jgi:hypothetical protein
LNIAIERRPTWRCRELENIAGEPAFCRSLAIGFAVENGTSSYLYYRLLTKITKESSEECGNYLAHDSPLRAVERKGIDLDSKQFQADMQLHEMMDVMFERKETVSPVNNFTELRSLE